MLGLLISSLDNHAALHLIQVYAISLSQNYHDNHTHLSNERCYKEEKGSIIVVPLLVKRKNIGANNLGTFLEGVRINVDPEWWNLKISHPF